MIKKNEKILKVYKKQNKIIKLIKIKKKTF